ncbi:MAG: hypothetical protein ACI8TF_002086 [Paracoccaceae bacterium]|jgi:hypothetical protein
MTHNFYKFWLKITAIVVGSLCLVFCLGAMVHTSESAGFTLDLLGLSPDGLQSYAALECIDLVPVGSGL